MFIGLAVADMVTAEMISSMAKDSVVFAMANPVPEIMPDLAAAAGAAVVGTGRSDFPNQINNSLVFPGVFRGALDAKASRITTKMKLAAGEALAAPGTRAYCRPGHPVVPGSRRPRRSGQGLRRRLVRRPRLVSSTNGKRVIPMPPRITVDTLDSLRPNLRTLITERARALPDLHYCDLRIEVREGRGSGRKRIREGRI